MHRHCSLTLLSFIFCFCTEDARSQQPQPLVSFQPATITLRSNCMYQTDCHDSRKSWQPATEGYWTLAQDNPGAQQHASRDPPATPPALAPSELAAAREPARGPRWQRWPGHYHPVNRAVLAQQLRLDKTYERRFLKPAERAVLASVLMTNRATVDTKIKMKTACKAGFAQKLQRQKDEKEESLRGSLLLKQQNGVNEQVYLIKISNTERKI